MEGVCLDEVWDVDKALQEEGKRVESKHILRKGTRLVSQTTCGLGYEQLIE